MWSPPQNQMFPWMQSFSKRLAAAQVPDLHGPNLWISSDYVFGNKNARFDTIAVLLAAPERSAAWEAKRARVRSEVLGGKRRMSFKSLGDRVRQKAFGPFLNAADSIEGVIITISIDKSLSEPLVFDREQIESANNRWCKQDWRYNQLERMLSVVHFIAFLVAGTSSADQNLYWISDQDDIFANGKYANDTGIVFAKFLNAHSRHDYGTISIGTTEITESDLLEEDLAAVADIAAGGTVELLTTIKNTYGIIPSFAVEVSDLPIRTEMFWDWFQDQSTNLKKIGCIFEQQGKSLRVKTWR